MAATLERTSAELHEQYDRQKQALARRESLLRPPGGWPPRATAKSWWHALLSEAVSIVGADDGGFTRWDERARSWWRSVA